MAQIILFILATCSMLYTYALLNTAARQSQGTRSAKAFYIQTVFHLILAAGITWMIFRLTLRMYESVV